MYDSWKQGQVAWQIYRHAVWEYGNELRKVKALLELNLSREEKSNKKGFYRYTSSKKKIRENVDLLQNEMGQVWWWDMETAQLLNAFFALIFTGKISLQETEPLSPTQKVWCHE